MTIAPPVAPRHCKDTGRHTLKQERSNPAALAKLATSNHFSSAVRVGNTIWLSGTVGIGPDRKPAEGMTAQARVAFEHLNNALIAAGAALGDVVELVTYHTDLQRDMTAFFAIKDEFFPKNYPAWTAVGVTQLAYPGLLVEIRAVAVVGSGH